MGTYLKYFLMYFNLRPWELNTNFEDSQKMKKGKIPINTLGRSKDGWQRKLVVLPIINNDFIS